jgi:hypothetical protein
LTRASARTLRATPAERVTLCRNGLTELGMESVYTTLHQTAPSTKRNNSGAEGYRFEPIAILIAIRRSRGDPCGARRQALGTHLRHSTRANRVIEIDAAQCDARIRRFDEGLAGRTPSAAAPAC